VIGVASGPGHGYEEDVLRQVLLVALVITAVVVGDTAASDAASHVEAVSLCRTVRASGGEDNGVTGGSSSRILTVKNAGGTVCAVAGRPWLRIPRLPHPVTVIDIVDERFAGTLAGRVLLKPRPGQRADLAEPRQMRPQRSRDVWFRRASGLGEQERLRYERDVQRRNWAIDVGPFRPV
jgi:hypothetical protein